MVNVSSQSFEAAMNNEATKSFSLSAGGLIREIKFADCTRRSFRENVFGQGFNSPRLHQKKSRIARFFQLNSPCGELNCLRQLNTLRVLNVLRTLKGEFYLA